MPIFALVFVVYATTLAGIGLGVTGESVRLYSAFKLAKPVCLVFLGLLLGAWTDPLEFIGILGRVYALLVLLTLGFTVAGPEFPAGDWGKYLFEWEVSGYPNTGMSFYAAMVPVLLAVADISKDTRVRPVVWVMAGCSTLLILGSMSRSSALCLMVGVAGRICS